MIRAFEAVSVDYLVPLSLLSRTTTVIGYLTMLSTWAQRAGL